MTKQEILDMFSDIDFAYNDSSKHETLSSMLDELMEEQKAVKPVIKIEQNEWTVCGICGQHLLRKWAFCPCCGRVVEWND